jgi:methyltransferase-like protein
MREQAERMLARSDATLLHDELAEVNDAVYFHEFAAHAARHGLQYLAEADFFEMQIGAASEPAAQALLAVEDPVRREQYLDFLKGRMFRQTLLCRAELAIDRTPHPEVIERLAVSTQAEPRGEPGADGAQAFTGPSGSTLTTDHPLVIAALKRAASAWPAALWVRDLLGPDGTRAERHALCDALLRSYAANLVALHVHPPRPARTPDDAPRATALARHQARAGETVTNLRHASVRIEDDLGRRLVTLLDGTRDRAALAAQLRSHLLDQGRPVPADLADGLERSLQGLARLALLETR